MNVVIPMAGRGQRFVDAGYQQPKPLIDVLGTAMYARAVDGLPLDRAARVIFVCLEQHLRDAPLADDIQRRYGGRGALVIPVKEVTDGQAATVLCARHLIDDDTPLLIYNADTVCTTSLDDSLSRLPADVDGLIGVFEADGDHWSFARTDERGRVLETAEKRRISPWATTGLYYFARGRDFVRAADEMIAEDDRVQGEFYVAPVYNRMISAGSEIRIDVAEEVWPLGTPEELDRFIRRS